MSRKRFLSVTNFDELQHYKDRNPIWIKLPCAILDDYEFSALPDELKFHALGLMLLASRLNNKFPDDEAWLRRKIGANSEINIKLLLEIEFLEIFREEKQSEKKQKIARKSNKTQDESASPTFEVAENCASAEQNRTEENKTQHNRAEQSETTRAEADAGNRVVCVDFKSSETESEHQSGRIKNEATGDGHLSQFSLADCLRYAEASPNVTNPQGLAHTLYKTGSADAFIRAMLYPEQQQRIEREHYGAPVAFTDEPCRACFGARMADPDGKGYRKCGHCRDECGKPTGFEPKGETNDETVY